METGEIALAPNTTRSLVNPVREDYLLTMKDVLKAQIRARLVVLSCCHSAREKSNLRVWSASHELFWVGDRRRSYYGVHESFLPATSSWKNCQ